MYELLRFWSAHNAELLFMFAAALLAYVIARFASARWPFALMFSVAPAIVFLTLEGRILRDFAQLFS